LSNKLLIDTLLEYKVDPYLIRTLGSYLVNRIFSLKLGNFLSSKFVVNRGVPQGSVLVPLLFVLYFNKVSLLLDKLHHLLFADDLVMYMA
jgi:hypothetical protein